MSSRRGMRVYHLLLLYLVVSVGCFESVEGETEPEAEAELECQPGLELGANETGYLINGTLDTPGYLTASDYPKMMIRQTEVWEIYMADADAILLTLLQMDVEACCDVFTICDILQTDPATNVTRAIKYTYDTNERGKDYPVLTSRTNYVRIRYAPRGNYFGTGFKIYYVGIQPNNTVTCDDRVSVTNEDNFKQLFFEAAPVFKSCYVFMRADPGFRIDLQVVFIDMEPTEKCTEQGLTLYNIFTPRGRNLANICRYRHQPQYFNFISENTDLLLGLAAKPGKPALIINYKVFNDTADDESQCELTEDFKDTDNYIRLKKYATFKLEFDLTESFDELTDNRVYWIIEKKRIDDILIIMFEDVDLTEGYNCSHDNITIKRGSCVDTSPVISYFCGKSKDRYTQTHGLWTVVMFQTDLFVNQSRFTMLYTLTPVVELKARPLEVLGLDDGSIAAIVVVPFIFICALVVAVIYLRKHYKNKRTRVLAVPAEGALYGKIDGIRVPPPFEYVRPADARDQVLIKGKK